MGENRDIVQYIYCVYIHIVILIYGHIYIHIYGNFLCFETTSKQRKWSIKFKMGVWVRIGI